MGCINKMQVKMSCVRKLNYVVGMRVNMKLRYLRRMGLLLQVFGERQMVVRVPYMEINYEN